MRVRLLWALTYTSIQVDKGPYPLCRETAQLFQGTHFLCGLTSSALLLPPHCDLLEKSSSHLSTYVQTGHCWHSWSGLVQGGTWWWREYWRNHWILSGFPEDVGSKTQERHSYQPERHRFCADTLPFTLTLQTQSDLEQNYTGQAATEAHLSHRWGLKPWHEMTLTSAKEYLPINSFMVVKMVKNVLNG